jgi:hypothetical protein
LYENSIRPDDEDAAGVQNNGLDIELMLLVAGNGVIKLYMGCKVRTIKEHNTQ